VRQTAIAAAGVGVPVLAVWLLTLVPWPSIPWPDVDLPDLPDLPGWVDTVRRFAIPVLIAFFIARGEVKRRRTAEEKRALDVESPGDSRSKEQPSPDGESLGDSRASGSTDPRS
jgi:hypothetical protein